MYTSLLYVGKNIFIIRLSLVLVLPLLVLVGNVNRQSGILSIILLVGALVGSTQEHYVRHLIEFPHLEIPEKWSVLGHACYGIGLQKPSFTGSKTLNTGSKRGQYLSYIQYSNGYVFFQSTSD